MKINDRKGHKPIIYSKIIVEDRTTMQFCEYKYLYRGVSECMHNRNQGKLRPKIFSEFEYTFKLSEGLCLNNGAKLGNTLDNAVIRHQLRQEGFPTSGISTTPFFERAKYYATVAGKYPGYIYKIDRKVLASHGVKEFIVADYTDSPSVPEDQEVILVAKDFGVLPDTIITERIYVQTISTY